jgi:hypothetical protein
MSQGSDPPVILFQGYPQTRQASWSDRHQAITVSAIYEPQEIVRTHEKTQVIGRLRRLNPLRVQSSGNELDLVTVESQAAHFNPDNKPNRLKDALNGAGDVKFYVFDDDWSKTAKFWNVADALIYVCMNYANDLADRHVSVAEFLWDTTEFVNQPPAPDTAEPFIRKMCAKVEGVSIQSMNVDAALAALCSAAGLHYEYALRTDWNLDPLWTATPEYFLRVFATMDADPADGETPPDRRMVSPLVHDIPRDKPFMDYTGFAPADVAARNEARKADLSLDTRAVTAPIFLAGAKEYQVTVLLRPGWMPHANVDHVVGATAIQAAIAFWDDAYGLDDTVNETERDPVTGAFLRWHSVYHRKHPDFASVADVWRRWIVPDDFSYLDPGLNDSPYARDSGPWTDWTLYSPEMGSPPVSIWTDRALGGSIEDALNWVPRARPFGDTIGRANPATKARNPRVFMNFHAPNQRTAFDVGVWVEYGVDVVIDPQRAAIWLGEDNLKASAALREDPLVDESSMIEAYLNGTFALCIAATVIGDERMRYAPTPVGSTLTRKRTAIVDLGHERFRFRKRVEPYAFPELDPEYQSRDDTEAFHRFADAAATAMAADVVAGSFTVPYIKTDVRLGDSFSGCEGMGIHFQSFPEVVAIEYVKDPDAAYQTIYHLTDLRHAPDVGSE